MHLHTHAVFLLQERTLNLVDPCSFKPFENHDGGGVDSLFVIHALSRNKAQYHKAARINTAAQAMPLK